MQYVEVGHYMKEEEQCEIDVHCVSCVMHDTPLGSVSAFDLGGSWTGGGGAERRKEAGE